MAKKSKIEEKVNASKASIEESVVENNGSDNGETIIYKWFQENVAEDKDYIRKVCELTNMSIHKQFGISIVNKKDVLVYAGIFHATFLAILKFLKSKRSQYSEFTIEIAKSINIGYENNDNEENEKVGNFTPILEYIGVNSRIVNHDDRNINGPDEHAEKAIAWKNLNVKSNADCCKAIQEDAFSKLWPVYAINLNVSELVIPCFCTFMDTLVAEAKEGFREAIGTNKSEVSYNVLGFFDIFYSYDEAENREIIEYQPNQTMKTELKSDNFAGDQ